MTNVSSCPAAVKQPATPPLDPIHLAHVVDHSALRFPGRLLIVRAAAAAYRRQLKQLEDRRLYAYLAEDTLRELAQLQAEEVQA